MLKTKLFNKKTGFISGLISSLIIGILIISFSITPDVVVEKTYIKSWHTLFEGVASEAVLTYGDSGILEIYFINHTATPTTTFSRNDSILYRTWCNTSKLGYANTDDFRVEIKHTTLFDILIKVRGNKTTCWNGSAFIDAYLRMNITSPHLGIAALSGMTGVVTHNDSGLDYLWMNFYINNSAAGYSIARGNESKIPTIRYQYYG